MLKNFLKKLLIIALELSLISGALWFLALKKGVKSPSQIVPALEQIASSGQDKITAKPFPELTQPKEQTFDWQYKGQKYTLKETLYASVYNYYKTQPKTFSYVGTLPNNWEEQYYGQFLKTADQDTTIQKLADDLQTLGKSRKLSDDQIVDLTLAFVQTIPYDDAKAKEILAKDPSATMRFPYEVLYEKLGVCSDKSLLAVSLLRQMGYGAAIFAYEQDNHMAIGVQCPQNYSTYGSGYCFGETTAINNKIGIIPNFDANSNKTVMLSDLTPNSDASLGSLRQVTIYQKTTGKVYQGIIETQKIASEIEQLKNSISSMLPSLQAEKKNIAAQQNNLTDLQSQLMKLRGQNNLDVNQYNAQVENYNNMLDDYKKEVKKYNSEVSLYNQAIARYNTLIKQ